MWSELSKEERNIGTLAAFRTTIRNKDVKSIVEVKVVGVNARAYAWVNWTCVCISINFSLFGRCTCLGSDLIYVLVLKCKSVI